MPTNDKEYQKKYHRKWYLKNRKERIKQINKRKKEILEWFREYKKSLSCEVCKENVYVCLVFHHKDSNKKETEISTAVAKNWGKKRLLEEIKKCNVLCANCHAKLHAGLIKIPH